MGSAKRSRTEQKTETVDTTVPAPLERSKSVAPMDVTEEKWLLEQPCFPMTAATEFVTSMEERLLGSKPEDDGKSHDVTEYLQRKSDTTIKVMELLADIGEGGAATDDVVPQHALRKSFEWAWEQVVGLGWTEQNEELMKSDHFVMERTDQLMKLAAMHVRSNMRRLELELMGGVREQDRKIREASERWFAKKREEEAEEAKKMAEKEAEEEEKKLEAEQDATTEA